MIRKLRTKFIMITAMALLSVIVVLVISINIVNMNNNVRDLDERLNMIFENAGEMPDFRGKFKDNRTEQQKQQNTDEPPKEKDMIKRNFSDISRFGTVLLDENKKITDVKVDKISSLSESEAKIYAKNIVKKGKEKGWTDQYRYKYAKYEEGYMIIILNGTFAKQSNSSVVIISSLVALISYIVVLLIIIMVSNRVIKPISDSYDKQKQFITDASHELKTPLTIIMANAEILELSEEKENEWITGIKKQTDKMKELVNSLVALTRMDENENNIVMEEFSISDAVYDTAMVFKGVCEQKKKKLNIDVQQDIMYKGDESSIRQLISVLLDNAVKYCDNHGEIDVNVSKGKNIWISVTNDYEDVANIEIDRLLDRFYRADKARVRNGSYGLGLSIANMIVIKHHGMLKIKNIDDKKIEFIVTLKI